MAPRLRSTIERRREARHAAELAQPDARDQDWYVIATEIDALLATGRYDWAVAWVRRMQARIIRTEVVTDDQLAALEALRRATRPVHDWARRFPWPID